MNALFNAQKQHSSSPSFNKLETTWQRPIDNHLIPSSAMSFQSRPTATRLIEWPLHCTGIKQLMPLIPSLQRLSQNQQWIVLIDPPYTPCASTLEQFGINTRHILWVHTKSKQQRLSATEKAIASTSIGAVLCWLPADATIRDKERLHTICQYSSGEHFLLVPNQMAPSRHQRDQTEELGQSTYLTPHKPTAIQ